VNDAEYPILLKFCMCIFLITRSQVTLKMCMGMLCYGQIPPDGPDRTLSETQVYDLVSDKVRSGVRQVRGLCLVVCI